MQQRAEFNAHPDEWVRLMLSVGFMAATMTMNANEENNREARAKMERAKLHLVGEPA